MSRTKRPPYGRIRAAPRGFSSRDPFDRTPLFVAPDEDQDQNQNQVEGEIEVPDMDGEAEAGGIEADGSSRPVRNSQSPLPMEVTLIVRRPTPEPINDFVPFGSTGDIQGPAAAQSVPTSERAIGEAESHSSQKGHGNTAEAIEKLAPLTEEQKVAHLAAQTKLGNEEQDNSEQPAVVASGATLPTPGEFIVSPIASSNDSRSPTVREDSPMVQQPIPEPIDGFVPLSIAKQPSVPAIQPSVPATQSSVPAIQPQPQPNAVATAAPRARRPRRSGLQLLAGNVLQNVTAANDLGVFARTRSKTQPPTPAPAPAPAPAPVPAAIKPRTQRGAPKKPSGVVKRPAKSRGKTGSAGPPRLVLRAPRAAPALPDNAVPMVQPFGRARVPALAPPQPQPQLQLQLGPVPVPVPQPRARAPARPSSHHPLSALQRETLQAQSDVLDRSIIRAAAQSVLWAREKEEIDRQVEQWMREKEEIDRRLE